MSHEIEASSTPLHQQLQKGYNIYALKWSQIKREMIVTKVKHSGWNTARMNDWMNDDYNKDPELGFPDLILYLSTGLGHREP